MNDTYDFSVKRLEELYEERKTLNDAIAMLERLKLDIEREEQIKKGNIKL
jgi:hypothetical protein